MTSLIIQIILLVYVSRETKCQPYQTDVSFSMAIPEPMILQPRQNQDPNQAQTASTQPFLPQNAQSSQFQTFPGQYSQQTPGQFQQQTPGQYQQQIPTQFQGQQQPQTQPGAMNSQFQPLQPGMPQFQQFQTPQNPQPSFQSNQYPTPSFQSQQTPTFTNNGMNFPPTSQMPQPITGQDFLQRPNGNQFSANQGPSFGPGTQYPNLSKQPPLNNMPPATFGGQNPQMANGVGGLSSTGSPNNQLGAQSSSTPGLQPNPPGIQSTTGIQSNPSIPQTPAALQNPLGAQTQSSQLQNPSGTQNPTGTVGQTLPQENVDLQQSNPETQVAASYIMKQLVSLLNDPTTRDAFVLMMTDFRNILSNPQAFKVIQSYNAQIQDRLSNPQMYNNNVPQQSGNNGGLGTTTITGTNGGSLYNNHPLQQPTDLASIITSTTSSLADLIKYKGRILTNLLRDEVQVKSKAVNGILGDIPGVNTIARMGTNFLDQTVNQVDKTFSPLLSPGNGGSTENTNAGMPGFGTGLTTLNRIGSGVSDAVNSFMNMGGTVSSVPGNTTPNNSNINGNNYPLAPVTTSSNYPTGYNEFNRQNKKR